MIEDNILTIHDIVRDLLVIDPGPGILCPFADS